MIKKERSPEFKKRVAIEALKEQKSLSEIASEYEVHRLQVSRWKKELIEKATTIFEPEHRKKYDAREREKHEAKLHEKIGQLTIELDWLKKKVGVLS